MKKYFILLITFILSFASNAQELKSFDDIKTTLKMPSNVIPIHNYIGDSVYFLETIWCDKEYTSIESGSTIYEWSDDNIGYDFMVNKKWKFIKIRKKPTVDSIDYMVLQRNDTVICVKAMDLYENRKIGVYFINYIDDMNKLLKGKKVVSFYKDKKYVNYNLDTISLNDTLVIDCVFYNKVKSITEYSDNQPYYQDDWQLGREEYKLIIKFKNNIYCSIYQFYGKVHNSSFFTGGPIEFIMFDFINGNRDLKQGHKLVELNVLKEKYYDKYENIDSIRKEKVLLGMTSSVTRLSLGKPYATGKYENNIIHIYKDKELWFKNDKLIEIRKIAHPEYDNRLDHEEFYVYDYY